MANVYARVSKITYAVGRADYISNPDRQEEIVLHKANMKYTWQEHSRFEQEQKQGKSNSVKIKNGKRKKDKIIEALEVVIALPNELNDNPQELERVCDSLRHSIIRGKNDYEYAVHWNKAHTNLHMHLLFSERENNMERTPKVYAKDIWQDRDTHKLAKANADNAVLVHRKGDIQKDKEGNIKYHDEPFKAKNRRFNSSSFIQEKTKIVQSVFERYGFYLSIQSKDSPFLSQKKLYKDYPEEYRTVVEDYNKVVREYNNAVFQHIRREPSKAYEYWQQRQEIEKSVLEAHKEGFFDYTYPVFSPKAIDIVREKLRAVLEALKVYKDKIAQKIAPKAQEKPVKAVAPKVQEIKPKPQERPVPDFVEESLEDDFVYELPLYPEAPFEFENTASPEKKKSVKERLKEAERQVKNKPQKRKQIDPWER